MLTLSDVSKSFGAVKALNNASLGMAPREIRAFLGANGSGKSTMVKILSGLVQSDTGTITLEGKEINTSDPLRARSQGIIAAYQDLSLLPKLSISENLALGHEKRNRFGLIDSKAKRELTEQMLEKVKIPAAPDTLVEELDPSLCSLVEFAKALTWNPAYLLIDEITASLYKTQVDHVFSLLRELAEKGVSILFVSHRLEEVFQLCSTATILRSGRTVAELNLSDVTEDDLVYHMTGETPKKASESTTNNSHVGKKPMYQKESVLEIKNLHVGEKVKNVSLEVYPGEIVGIAGLQGQGQTEFLRALYGFLPAESGEIMVNGKHVRFKSPAKAIKHGIGFLPGERGREGVFAVRPISENIFAARDGIRGALRLDSKTKSARETSSVIDTLKIVASGPFAPASSLSGGNQQKLVVGRWLAMDLKVLILDDPTKGVDVSSRKEIHRLLRTMTEKGVSLLYSSSDNEELLDIADRIIIFFDGEILSEVSQEEITPDVLASLTLGVTGEGVQ